MTSRFPKLTLRPVTDSNGFVIVVLSANAIRLAAASIHGQLVSIIQNATAEQQGGTFPAACYRRAWFLTPATGASSGSTDRSDVSYNPLPPASRKGDKHDKGNSLRLHACACVVGTGCSGSPAYLQ